jgi:hypothetical protein
MSNVVKAIKRAMAAEYSKNLGDKVLAGSITIALQGYKVGGKAPFGYERMRLDQARNPVGILKDGQRKAIANERVKLTPGEASEREAVQYIFDAFTKDKQRELEIAVELNKRKILSPGGEKWTDYSIRMVLKNETYLGTLLYNKHTQRLKGKGKTNSRDKWVIVPQAFEALITQEQFHEAQQILKQRSPYYTDSELLDILQKIFQEHGKINGLIIESMGNAPTPSTIRRHFGSLINAYKLVGYTPPGDFRFIEMKTVVKEVEDKVIYEIIERFEGMGFQVLDCGGYIRINDQLNIDILGSSIRNNQGKKRWSYKFDRKNEIDITIAIRLKDDDGKIEDFYVFPMIAMEMERLFVNWANGIYLDTFRFSDLGYFYNLFFEGAEHAADNGSADFSDKDN